MNLHIVGGGIAGLAAAWELSSVDGARVTVHEASDHLGGKIHTSPFAGLAVDEGADAFLLRVPWALDLVRELDLEDQLVHPAERRAYIWSRGALRPLPQQHVLGVPLDLADLEATGLLDEVELGETHAAYDAPGTPVTADDISVADLVAGAAGRPVLNRVVAPLLGGINAGRVEDMSAATLTPQLLAAGRHPQGLLAGLREQRAAVDPEAPVFGSFEAGTQLLVDRLVERLVDRGVELLAGDPVGSPEDLQADGLVVATQAYEAARLLGVDALARIPYVSVVLVTVAVPAADIDRPLDASGFLVARPEGLLLTACSWSSRKWAHLGGRDTVVLRASAGSADDPRAFDLPDDELAVQLLDELSTTMALAGPPGSIRISRWQRSLPQYAVGHADLVAEAEAELPPGVVLAGAAYRGVGIPACIHDGREAARRLLDHLGVIVSLLAGLLLAFSLPPWGWWPLALVAFALLSRQLDEPLAPARAKRGALFAVGWFAPAVFWMVDFTLPGYAIAVGLWAAFWAVVAIVTPPGRWRWLVLPAAAVLAELIRWSWPFGGQPLATIPMSQVASPLGPTVRLLGPLLLAGLVVVVGVALDAFRSGARRTALAALVGVVLVVLLAGVAPDGHPTDSIDVALVQGGGPQNTRAEDTDEREVFDRHLAASEDVEGPVDLVVWPENVINVEGPLDRVQEGEELSALARRLDTTLVVGAVEGDGDGFHNSAIAYDRDGEQVDRYEKVRRVPFGEYVPLRGVLEPFAGNALPARDAIEGEGPATLDTPVGRLGVVISWEVFFANRARDAIGNGGEVLLNPTNGSSYWLTIVQTQQIASSRLRAMETGRWVLQAAPTGLTAIITPDGEVLDRTSVSQRAIVQGTVELREGETIYTRLGDWPMALLALVLLLTPRAARWWGRRSPG